MEKIHSRSPDPRLTIPRLRYENQARDLRIYLCISTRDIVDLSSVDFFTLLAELLHISLFSIQMIPGYRGTREILLSSIQIEFIAESISFC